MGSLRITPTCLMNKKTLQVLFIVFALLALAATVYPAIGSIKPFDATPAWRHILFVGINIICIYGLLKRPYWFIWFWTLLTLQQLCSHGSHFVRLLSENKFTWIDFGVLVLMPVIFILMLIDKRSMHHS